MLRESMKVRITVSLAFLYILYYVLTGIPRSRAGHIPTFLKSFFSVLERGPSAIDCSVLVAFFFNQSVP